MNVMFRIVRRATVLILAFALCAGLCSVYAQSDLVAQAADSGIEAAVSWTHVGGILSDLTISSNGVATVNSMGHRDSGGSIKVIAQLQQLTTSKFETIAAASSTGYMTASVTFTHNVTHGYAYRNLTTVEAYDANGNLLEVATFESIWEVY